MVEQDRANGLVAISAGDTTRCHHGAQVRGPWSLGHLRGFPENNQEYHIVHNSLEPLKWFEAYFAELLESSFLSSDDLNRGPVQTSPRLFGHDSHCFPSCPTIRCVAEELARLLALAGYNQ
jgi:hypothetical protein